MSPRSHFRATCLEKHTGAAIQSFMIMCSGVQSPAEFEVYPFQHGFMRHSFRERVKYFDACRILGRSVGQTEGHGQNICQMSGVFPGDRSAWHHCR